MNRGGLDALIRQTAQQLRNEGRDPSVADALRQHEALYEVLGPWPPQTPPKATPKEVDDAIVAVRHAVVALAEVKPAEPGVHKFQVCLGRLSEVRLSEVKASSASKKPPAAGSASG